ncbi:MAG: aspartate aminotransferase [Verrucomicrobiales bacterium]|jgi:aspartate aminotransferase
MSFVAERISQLTPSMTLSITSQAKRMRDEGVDVCGFGAGEPDFDTPDFIKAAAIKAIQDGKTKYTPASGIPELRQAIAKKLLMENSVNVDKEQVIVSSGAKHSLFNAITAVCDPGDEVIIPAPYWVSYPEMVRIAGAEPVIVETSIENGWKMTAEQFDDAMTARTKMVIINSPGNPTGAVYTADELKAIGEVAASEDIIIISDEIYEKLIYNELKHVSIASLGRELADLTITVNGFSKAYSMTGWRLGYLAAPPEIAKAIGTVQSHTTSNPTSFAQYGALEAVKADQQFVADMRDEFDMRRQYMLGRLKSINNISVVEPEGAFYFLVDTTQMGIKSVNLSEKLLARYQVAAVPGIAFGNDYSLRLSYATGLDVIKEGLDRFEDFCASH